MKSKIRCVVIMAFTVIILLIGLLAGCGRGGRKDSVGTAGADGTGTDGVSTGGGQQADAAADIAREVVDLLQITWRVPAEGVEPVEADPEWHTQDYGDNIISPQDGDLGMFSYTAVDGSDFYVLNTYYTDWEDEEQAAISGTSRKPSYYMDHFNGETLQSDCTELHVDVLEQKWSAVVGLDAACGRLMVFVQEWDLDTKETIHFYAIKMGADGSEKGRVDLLPAIEECGSKPEKQTMLSGAKWDGRGYFYLVHGKNVDVMDENGEFQETVKAPGGAGSALSCRYRTPEGALLFEVQNPENKVVNYFYYGENGLTALAEAPWQFAVNRCVTPGGDLVYFEQGNLMRWDAVNGTVTRLCAAPGTELDRSCELMVVPSGKVFAFYKEQDKVSFCSYSGEPLGEEVLVVLESLLPVSMQLKLAAADFSKKHAGITIEIKEGEWEQQEANWNRVMTEFVAGKGSDMLLADREKMLVLQGKGALARLDDVLTEELRKQIFSSVLAYGKAGESLYGITYSARPQTLMVSKQVWDRDTWSVEDVLDVIDKKAYAGNPIKTFRNSNYGELTADGMLYDLVFDLEQSPFLDMERGECHFDSELFVRLLETCKKYGAKQSEKNGMVVITDGSQDEQRSLAKSGEVLAYSEGLLDFVSYSKDRAALGEDFKCLGYPTDGTSGNFLYCFNTLMVNAGTKHREVIDEFLRYLLSKEYQLDSYDDGIVRRDALTDAVQENSAVFGGPVMVMGDRTYELEKTPGGGSYLEDYLAFLDGCVLSSGAADEVLEIVLEEAPAYFNGDKDAKSVAGVIQNRVRLYLNERK